MLTTLILTAIYTALVLLVIRFVLYLMGYVFTENMSYEDRLEFDKGKIKVERMYSTKEKNSKKWSKPGTMIVWIDKSEYKPTNTYSKDSFTEVVTCYRDKKINFKRMLVNKGFYIYSYNHAITLIDQNSGYKNILAQPSHFPTEAREEKLFDVKTVKTANGQRYTVTLSDGTYSLPYVDYANWNKGKIKVTRTTYTRKHANGQWKHNPSVKDLWIDEENYSPKETYSSDNLTVYQDKMIELDWRKESDNVPQYNVSQMELIKQTQFLVTQTS